MLTIISITKNDLEGIQRNLNSTLFLRKSNLVKQIIIDSSIDSVQQEIQKLIQGAIGLEYFWQEPQGISKAFNYGIELAPNGWLWFLNGGDEVHSKLDIEYFLKVLRYTQANVIIFELEYDTGKITKHPPLYKLWPPIFNWIPHPATIIRKEILVAQGKFSEEYTIAMDGELWFRLLSKDYTTDLISIPIAKFYEGGLSSNTNETSREVKEIIISYSILLFKMWLKSGIGILKAIIYYTNLAK